MGPCDCPHLIGAASVRPNGACGHVFAISMPELHEVDLPGKAGISIAYARTLDDMKEWAGGIYKN